MRGDGRRLAWCVVAGLLLLAGMPVAAQGQPPQLDSIDPAAGSTEGGTLVTLMGKHLAKTSSVQFGGIAARDFATSGNDRITATSPPHSAGIIEVKVTTPGGSNSIAFEYVTPPPPAIDTLDPGQGSTQGSDQVTILGSGLSGSTVVRFGSADATSFDVRGDGEIRAVTPSHAAGTVDLLVETPQGAATQSFTFVAPPTITGLDPAEGSTDGDEDVMIQGTGLADTTAVRFGSVAASFEVLSGTAVRAVTPQHAAGTVDLRVETPYGAATRSFTFKQGPASAVPTIDALTPGQGPTEGGTEVVVDGTGLGDATGVFLGGKAATSFEVVDASRLRVVTPPHAAGTVDLRVETPDGSAAHSFTFVASQNGPVIDQLTPTSGPTAGGTELTITGSGLSGVTRVTFGGTEATPWTVQSDGRIVARTPAHAAGTVQVELQHPEGTAVASFTYTEPANDDPADDPAPPPEDSQTEDLQSIAPNPVQTGARADVVRSGTPDINGIGSCWVLLATTTPGQRVVVPFPPSCDVEAVVVEAPAVAGLLNVSVYRMVGLPSDVPSPGIVRGPGLVFEAVIRDMDGQEVAPSDAVLQVRMPGTWLDVCPPQACATDLFHYDGANWTTHAMRAVDQGDGFLVMQADVSSFSLFAVGGTPLGAVDDSAMTWPWVWMIGGLAMVGAPAAVTVWRRRRTQPEDPKVGMLLREMSDKEELLQFLNNAAHDLANPLTPIQLQLDVLVQAAETTDPEEQRRALRLVQQNVEQMTMLVGDLRDAAKVRSGRLRFFPAQHDLGGMLAEAVAMVETQAAQGGISLVYEAPGREVPVRIDRGRILQVVTNLLGNALKFTPKGGRIELVVQVNAATARVKVTDTGLGMTREGQAALFQPFSQSHGDAEKAKGTGLGLYISKGIVEAHDGRIGCHSDGPGHGSTFWFTLPLDAT